VLNELVEYVRELDDEVGFEEVQTPELNRTDLWKTSGHYDFFFRHDDAYSWEDGDEEYGLKPTDCPNHMRLYDTEAHSYRDLPVRYTEIATIYRKHKSGETKGITRTRRYRQPDGHAFVRPDQIHDELVSFIEKFEELADTFGLDTEYNLATRSPDSVGDEADWEEGTERLREVLDTLGVEYDQSPTAAFYAPEIEVSLVDDLGRSWKGSGYQLDYTLPKRFDLTYVDENGEKQRPVVIHRGLLVSFEYLLGLLLEHFEGRLPLWLSPTQVRVLPISDENLDYAEQVADSLDGFRTDVDDRSWTLSRKIRAAHDERVPYMLVVGDDEAEDGTVTVRNRDGDEVRGAELSEVATLLQQERDERAAETSVVARLS
jgi:threonyl-tRNA synthetase